MNVDQFLDELRNRPDYRDQIVHVHEVPARVARYADGADEGVGGMGETLARIGIERLYCHQAQAVRLAGQGRNVLTVTGTASGKTLCYTLPLLRRLKDDPEARALLLFPTKALCQDQFKNFSALLAAAGLSSRMAGVFDGDTPSALRRKLRDHGSVIFSNPDMVHAALLSQHARWAEFLGKLTLVVLDELHVYSGIFGSNMALLVERFLRVCRHYGSRPQFLGSSATIANPLELARKLTGLPFELVDDDGSPRGRRVYVFWNPPRTRQRTWRSRRSANVEAHELMARLIEKGIPTITFSKAKMTAEMIHRYVREALQQTAPEQAAKITPYRGGYLPAERREIEERLFSGKLLGVSTTPALELGIDVGALDASILVGYPGTRASFLQQAGRAGRRDQDSVVFLIGLDTSINQYIMTNPSYIFDRCVEEAVIDPENPFVVTGHLRCATHEKPVTPDEFPGFSRYAEMVLRVLKDNQKVNDIDGAWYHASSETPQHEISLRSYADANVIIEEEETQRVLGEVNRYDAEPIVHPGAIYMHRGETYRVLTLDMDRNIATVRREETDYYTQPLGGTDIHHVDHRLREKPFGTGSVCWGEVTAHFNTYAYEKIHFYTLDALSVHGLDLPTLVLETLAIWLVPPESLMESVRRAGLDAHSGLRGIGYATRMLLPLFMTCDTLDFSHTVGSVNSPWNAVFIYERYPHGLGFTEKAYHLLHEIMPRVHENVSTCPCEKGCPCCVGKPLRQFTTWNVERGEASIPSKAAALMILEGFIGDGMGLDRPDTLALDDSGEAEEGRLELALRRRLERMREPQVFHPIIPGPEVETGYPNREQDGELTNPDVSRRSERRRGFEREMHKRIAKKLDIGGLEPLAGGPPPPPGMSRRGSNLRPTDFPGRPAPSPPPPVPRSAPKPVPNAPPPGPRVGGPGPIVLGDPLAACARKRYKKKSSDR